MRWGGKNMRFARPIRWMVALLIDNVLDVDLEGIKAVEPSFGLEALWISKDNIEEAELRGYTIVDPSTILVTHLLEIIKEKSHELMGREEVKAIMDATKEKYSVIVDELIPDIMTLGEVQKV